MTTLVQNTTVKCFAYLRVSGLTQVNGDGFPRQLATCQAYAEAHGMEIVEVFSEGGVSGTTEIEGRTALPALFAALAENGIKTVIIEKLDRLARDLMVQETILLDMEKSGYTLISAMEPDLCSNDPSRVLMRQIFGAIAQYDKTMIVLKLQAGRARIALRDGKCGGRFAFGEKSETERTILARMRSLRDSGMIYVDIAKTLTTEGHASRMGRAWSTGAVAKILSREKGEPNA